MIAVALAVASISGQVDPSVTDLLLSQPEWSDSFPTFARAFVEYGDKTSALALLDRWSPPRNKELYAWHMTARNASGMIDAISKPYRPVPLPITRMLFPMNEERVREGVAFVLDADRLGNNLELIDEDTRKQFGLTKTDSQLYDLCVLLSNSGYKSLSARVFSRYCKGDAGPSEVAKYLASISADEIQVNAFLPDGPGMLSTHELVLFASSYSSATFDEAAIHALLTRDMFVPGFGAKMATAGTLCWLLNRLHAEGHSADVRRILRRYEDKIDDWIIDENLFYDSGFQPLLVQYGMTQVLQRTAETLWKRERLAVEAQVAKGETSVNISGITCAAKLYTYAGDGESAKRAIALAKSTSNGLGMRLADYECQRLLWLDKHMEAIRVQLSEEWGNLQSAVSVFNQMLASPYSTDRQVQSAKEIVSYMQSVKRYDDWYILAPGLLRLGLKAELRSILEAVTANRFQNKREYDDVFRAYLALGEKDMALKYAFPWEPHASWLLDLLYGWEDEIHGSKSQLLDVDGRNIFEEGITGFRDIVQKHPFWVVNFEYLLRFVALNRPLTDRVIVELRTCLALLSDEFARSESLDLLKEMFARQPQELPTLSVQRDVVAAIRDRLKTAPKTFDHR